MKVPQKEHTKGDIMGIRKEDLYRTEPHSQTGGGPIVSSLPLS